MPGKIINFKRDEFMYELVFNSNVFYVIYYTGKSHIYAVQIIYYLKFFWKRGLLKNIIFSISYFTLFR